jgi:hypothetical protein
VDGRLLQLRLVVPYESSLDSGLQGCFMKFKPSVLLPGILALACSSCSFIFVRPPHHSDDRFPEVSSGRCTSSKVAPAVDGVIAALEGTRTTLALSADSSAYQNSSISRNADVGFGLGFTALFLASSIYGFYETDQCHHTPATTPVGPPEDSDHVPRPAAPLDRHATPPSPPAAPPRKSPEEP